jgi:hypothetical protein
MQPGKLPRPERLVQPLPFVRGSLPDKPPPLLAQPDVPFPLEALLAPDRDKALDEWSSARPRRQAVPRTPATPDAGGSVADLIMNCIRSRKAQDADQSQRPAFITDALRMPLAASYATPSTDGENDPDDPRDRASIRRLSRFPALSRIDGLYSRDSPVLDNHADPARRAPAPGEDVSSRMRTGSNAFAPSRDRDLKSSET